MQKCIGQVEATTKKTQWLFTRSIPCQESNKQTLRVQKESVNEGMYTVRNMT